MNGKPKEAGWSDDVPDGQLGDELNVDVSMERGRVVFGFRRKLELHEAAVPIPIPYLKAIMARILDAESGLQPGPQSPNGGVAS